MNYDYKIITSTESTNHIYVLLNDNHKSWNTLFSSEHLTHWVTLQDIGLVNGLVSSYNKPLSEPMLTQIYIAVWCH